MRESELSADISAAENTTSATATEAAHKGSVLANLYAVN